MKIRVSIIAGLFALSALLSIPLPASAEYSHGENGSNWMSYISSSTPLSQITIPGTHESASASGTLSSEAQCQNENIDQQLADGTRYFDLRCNYEGHGYPNALSMHHSFIFEGSYLDDVLNSMYSFLSAHPTETIIVCIKEEYSSESGTTFADMVSTYIQQNINAWYFGSTVPTLGSVRGKIVLMRRFGAQGNGQAIGIGAWGWLDDQTYFNAGNGNPNIYVQDLYEPSSVSAKWTAFFNQILNADNDNNMNNMYINMLSAAWPYAAGTIQANANALNPMLQNDAQSVFSPHRYGIIAIDYSSAAMASCIYELNDGPFGQGIHQFVNANSGLVLDGTLNTYNGALVDQYQNASATQEFWTLYPLGGGLYEIANNYSGNCLDIAGGSKSNGGSIDNYGWANSINEEFFLSPDSYGTYEIVSLLDGNVVEIGGNATNNGAFADQWSWAGTASQRWTVK